MRPDAAQAEVICYSGHTYAERPIRFRFNRAEYPVEEIIQQTRTPDGRQFLVRTEDERRFVLTYLEAPDQWQVRPLYGPLPSTQGEKHTRYDE